MIEHRTYYDKNDIRKTCISSEDIVNYLSSCVGKGAEYAPSVGKPINHGMDGMGSTTLFQIRGYATNTPLCIVRSFDLDPIARSICTVIGDELDVDSLEHSIEASKGKSLRSKNAPQIFP